MPTAHCSCLKCSIVANTHPLATPRSHILYATFQTVKREFFSALGGNLDRWARRWGKIHPLTAIFGGKLAKLTSSAFFLPTQQLQGAGNFRVEYLAYAHMR